MKKRNIRASWQDYNISPQRLDELTQIVRSGEHEELVDSAAHMADEKAAGHIVLSIKRNMSYESLEAKQALGKIERIALGRTDFYGARRLFFHHLDCALKEQQENNGTEEVATQKRE